MIHRTAKIGTVLPGTQSTVFRDGPRRALALEILPSVEHWRSQKCELQRGGDRAAEALVIVGGNFAVLFVSSARFGILRFSTTRLLNHFR
jgi:hypothetical protein